MSVAACGRMWFCSLGAGENQGYKYVRCPHRLRYLRTYAAARSTRRGVPQRRRAAVGLRALQVSRGERGLGARGNRPGIRGSVAEVAGSASLVPAPIATEARFRIPRAGDDVPGRRRQRIGHVAADARARNERARPRRRVRLPGASTRARRPLERRAEGGLRGRAVQFLRASAYGRRSGTVARDAGGVGAPIRRTARPSSCSRCSISSGSASSRAYAPTGWGSHHQ